MQLQASGFGGGNIVITLFFSRAPNFIPKFKFFEEHKMNVWGASDVPRTMAGKHYPKVMNSLTTYLFRDFEKSFLLNQSTCCWSSRDQICWPVAIL